MLDEYYSLYIGQDTVLLATAEIDIQVSIHLFEVLPRGRCVHGLPSLVDVCFMSVCCV